MKKIIILTFIQALLLNSADAQKGTTYLKGGLSLLLGGAETSDELTVLPSFTIAPGFLLVNSKEFSLSTELPVSFGASFEDNGTYFGINIPATMNLNFGYGSSAKSTSKFGIGFGAGKGYHYSYNYFFTDYDNTEYSSLSLWGTVFNTTLSFCSKKKSNGVSVRFMYMSNFDQQTIRKNVFGISLLANAD